MGRASELRFEHDGLWRHRVLLATCHTDDRRVLRMRLEGDGHCVRVVSDVSQLEFALELVAARLGPAPHALIVDIGLGGGDALETLRQHRSELRKTCVFVLCDALDRDDLDDLERDGVIVFRPPIDHDDIRYAVSHTEFWDLVRPSRAFFERVARRKRDP